VLERREAALVSGWTPTPRRGSAAPARSFRAAACHAASVFLDMDRTAQKAVDLIGEASRAGAELIVFPESFLPGFPVWVALQAPTRSHELFRAFVAESADLNSEAIRRVRQAARRQEVYVSLGFSESTRASVGCVWNSNLLIGPDGSVVNHHRKLVPTFFEKLVWAPGDARGLRVSSTDLGRIGMLICGENTNPLARFTLMAEGEQVHLASYPPAWPTRAAGQPGTYDLTRAIEIRAAAHSFEAKAYTVVASGVVDETMRRRLESLDRAALETLDGGTAGISLVVGPDGAVVGSPVTDGEAILYADIDPQLCVEQKQFHDLSGSYNRFDIFQLRVDRSAREPVEFISPQDRFPQYLDPTGGGADQVDGIRVDDEP
jgi:nitrilase